MRFSSAVSLVAFFLLSLSGCSIPFLGGDDSCEYRTVFSIARVTAVLGDTVTFEVSGHRTVEKRRSELPPDYDYAVGNEFNVQQKFLTGGDNCVRYIFEIIHPA